MTAETLATGEAPFVSIRRLSKAFGAFQALREINLDVKRGEFVSFLGPSGCGKTTLLRAIAGLDRQTSGTIHINGRDVSDAPPSERDFGIVFQSYALFPNLTIAENVGYGLVNQRRPKAEIAARVGELLEMVGLSGQLTKYPAQLSGGQQQRVAVARAIVLEPEVLLLDEPLSNLDAKLRRHVREEIRQIQQRLGLTAVYVTHDQEEAMAVSDRIIVMKNAEIAQEGTPHDLYDRPANAFIADFIGDANLVDVEVIRSGAETEIELQGRRLRLPLASTTTGPAKMVLRPHHIRLSRDPGPERIPAEVTYAAWLGNSVQYTLSTDVGPIFAIAPPQPLPFQQGESVQVGFAPGDARLVPA